MEKETRPWPNMWLSTYSDITVWADGHYVLPVDGVYHGPTELHLPHGGGGAIRNSDSWPDFVDERLPRNWIIT